jgi:DNA-binding MarR family transcriptional regulator
MELDKVEQQILVVIGNEKDQKARLVDLERKVDASKQTVSNRVDAMVAAGLLTDKKGGFPQTRWFTLTSKGYQLLQKIRIVDFVSASEFFTVRPTAQDIHAVGQEHASNHPGILEHLGIYCTQQLTQEELRQLLRVAAEIITRTQNRPFQLVFVHQPTINEQEATSSSTSPMC